MTRSAVAPPPPGWVSSAAFSDSDPITRGAERVFAEQVPGARGMPHVVIKAAGHFLQEDKGVELAHVVHRFITDYPISAIALDAKL